MSDEPESDSEARSSGAAADLVILDEAAPEEVMPVTGRQKLWLAARVVLKRVRFFLILLAVGALIGYWDTVKNYWDKWTRPRATAARELAADQEFFCPMHPSVVRSTYEPNGDVPKCPICGMPLSIHKKGEKEALPPGITGRVQLTPERIQLAGVRTVPVQYRPVAKETTTVGYVAYDEGRLSRVVTRVKGYVEKLYVDKTYATVREGEPLAEIYSPELYSTAQELLIAHRRNPSSDLVALARERLRLFGVSDQEIDEIVRSGVARPRVVIRSPQSGYVIEKKIVAGSSVEPGMTLLGVADLDKVWIEAEVYEKDVALLEPGQPIQASVEALANETFAGRVALVYPQVEAATRTNRVRFELDNPGHKLRPGMFATVRIDTPLDAIEPYKTLAARRAKVVLASGESAAQPPPAEFAVVPERAVIDTGLKKVVYVEREPGLFEGVEVQLGPRVEVREGARTVDYYPVVNGLQAGDRVADAGAFLIDAETRLNPAAASSYFGASGGPQGGRGGSSGGYGPEQGSEKPPAKDGLETRAVEPSAEDLENVAQLPDEERQLALRQRFCPVTEKPLGSMGVPVKITLRGKPVMLCCKGCAGKAKKAPDEMLQKIARYMAAGSS